jgi:hypothetical protein
MLVERRGWRGEFERMGGEGKSEGGENGKKRNLLVIMLVEW